MIAGRNIYKFFISAQTPYGFKSYIDEFQDLTQYKRLFLLKGGAGSGKSTFIRKAASILHNEEGITEMFFCASDINSLDAAAFHNRGVALADATPPHIIEPKYPSVFERVVSFYDFFDLEKLAEIKERIEKTQKLQEMLSARAQNFIKAAGLLLSSNYSICARCILSDKLTNFITRLCMRELKGKKEGEGKLHKRFLSTVTGDGVFVFTDTIEKICDKLYVIEDEYGAVSDIILKSIQKMALSLGFDVYSCACPISVSEKLEHLFIPELNLGFTTSNKFHPYKKDFYKKIRVDRFMDKEKLCEYNYRSNFQKKAARELLLEATEFKKQWLQTHLELESLYNSACKFREKERYSDDILSELL